MELDINRRKGKGKREHSKRKQETIHEQAKILVPGVHLPGGAFCAENDVSKNIFY